MDCLPTYKGKRFGSLAEIASQVKAEKPVVQEVAPDTAKGQDFKTLSNEYGIEKKKIALRDEPQYIVVIPHEQLKFIEDSKTSDGKSKFNITYGTKNWAFFPTESEAIEFAKFLKGDVVTTPTDPVKIPSPQIDKPYEDLSMFDIRSNSYKEAKVYNDYLGQNPEKAQDFVMKKLDAKPGDDPKKVLSENIQITSKGFNKSNDGDVAVFSDPQGEMISYGMISIDDTTKQKYYVSFNPQTGKQSVISLDQAQKTLGEGYSAIIKDQPDSPLVSTYVTPEEWQKATHPETEENFSNWMYKSMSLTEKAEHDQADEQLRKEGVAFDPENPQTFTPSNKGWWFKSGFNSSVIGKSYQMLSWHNIKAHLFGDFESGGMKYNKDTKAFENVSGKTTRPPVFELGEYSPSMVEEIASGAFSILADTPLFALYGAGGAKAGAKIGAKTVEFMAKRNWIKYGSGMVDDLVGKGINRGLAERYVANGLAKSVAKAKAIGSRFGGSAGALGIYDYQNDVLNQVTESNGEWGDVDYAHSLKEGAIGATLGFGLGWIGMGTSFLNKVLTNPTMGAVEKMAIKVGIGAASLPVETGMFVYGKQGLQGKPLSDITARDYGVMLGTLWVLKGQHYIQSKGKKAFSKSKDHDPSKINKGKFEVQFTPEEIEYINKNHATKYSKDENGVVTGSVGNTTEEIVRNLIRNAGKIDPESKRISSITISDIMADPEVPQSAKDKLVFTLGGWKREFDSEVTDLNLRTEGDTYYLEAKNANGDLVDVVSTKDLAEANKRIEVASMGIIDRQKMNMFAELPEMEKALILSQIKGSGGNLDAVQESWQTHHTARTPDQQKLMDQLYTETDKWVTEKQKRAEKAAKEAETAKPPKAEEVKPAEPKIEPEVVKPIVEEKPKPAEEPKVETPVEEPRKEVWEMTSEEWGGEKEGGMNSHREIVAEAFKRGFPVPEKVLAEYPELKKPKTPPKTKEAIDTNPVTGAKPEGDAPTGGTKVKEVKGEDKIVTSQQNTAPEFEHPIYYYINAKETANFKSKKEFVGYIKKARLVGSKSGIEDYDFEREFGTLENYYDWVKSNDNNINSTIQKWNGFIDGLSVDEKTKKEWKNNPENFELNLQLSKIREDERSDVIKKIPIEEQKSERVELDTDPQVIVGEVLAQEKWSKPNNKVSIESAQTLIKNKDKKLEDGLSTDLEDGGYVEEKDGVYEITPKGRELIRAIEAREETIRGLNEGWDLFPNDADIEMIRANQKKAVPIKLTRTEIKSITQADQVSTNINMGITTRDIRRGDKVAGTVHEFIPNDEYEFLTTNASEKFVGELVMPEGEKIDQTKPMYAGFFGGYESGLGYEKAIISNDLKKVIDIMRDFDTHNGVMEVYDPASKLMESFEIFPFEQKYTEESVSRNIKVEAEDRQTAKEAELAQEEVERQEANEAAKKADAKMKERQEFEANNTPKEERPEPVEVVKEDVKTDDIPDKVYEERAKEYQDFVETNGFAIRTGSKGTSGYYATPGMSTYYDPYSQSKEGRFYDISLVETVDSGSRDAQKILTEALKDPDLTPDKKQRVQEALDAGGYIDYQLIDEVWEVRRAAERLGFDGAKVWENDDAGSPSSVLIWNNYAITDLGSVMEVRENMISGKGFNDPRKVAIPDAELMEPIPGKKTTGKKAYKPLDAKGQLGVMKKLANGKAPISICNEVHVENGVATVTDLEHTIQMKSSLPDGMYRIVGTDLVPSKTPMNEFPITPSLEKDSDGKKLTSVRVNLNDISEELRAASTFIVKDDLRPVMSGIHIKSDGKKVYIESTDAHRLYSKALDMKMSEFEVVIPVDAVKLLLSNPTNDIQAFEIGQFNTKISTRDFDIITHNIDGKYPTVQAVIPQRTFHHYTMNKTDLVAAIDKVMPYENKSTHRIELYVDAEKGEITVRAVDIDMELDKSVKIKAEIESGSSTMSDVKDLRLLMPVMGEAEGVINVNSKYLRSVAESISGDKITMHNATAQTVQNRAYLFTGDKLPIKAEKTPKVEKQPVVEKEKVTGLITEFSKNFAGTENVSDVVGGKDAIKLKRSDGTYMILDPSSTDIAIESIWVPSNKRNQGVARLYMKELINLADKNGIPLTLRAVPEVVEGKDVIPKDKLKQFYEKLGFVFTGDKGVRLPEAQNKPRTATKPSKDNKSFFAADIDLSGTPSSEKGKKPAEDTPKAKVTMDDAEIIIPEHWSKDVKPEEVFKAIDFPEMVDIVHKMIGKYPQPKNMGNSRALGYFRHGDAEPMIALKRALFIEANYPMLKHVLAHEIGHLNDWFPDADMRRGNILGRISSGKSHLASTLGEKPGKTNILTPKERERLRNDARKAVREASEKTERQIIEEIVKEIPVFDEAGMSADDVAAIWRDVNAREKYPELYEYVARLNAAQKRQIMVEALKGIVNSDIARKFKKQIGTEKVTEQIIKLVRPLANTQENIKKMYKKMLMEEINKRRLFDKETITKELMDVTQVWRRYDPKTATAKEKAYRESPEELYADAFSMLMNDPERLQKMAPVFYNAFFSWWDAKSGSKKYFDEIQALLSGEGGSGKPPGLGTDANEMPLEERRLNNMMDGYKEGEQKRLDIANEKHKSSLSWWSHFKREFISNRVALFSKVDRDTGKKLTVDLNSEQAIDNATQMLLFTRDHIGELLTDINVMIEKPLADAGLSPYEFGALLEAERNLTQYKDKARPLGMQTEPSQRLKEFIYRRYTPEQRQVMEGILQNFHDKVFEIMDMANQSGLFTPEQWQIISEGKDVYATYSKVKYIHENFISSKIIEAEGSLEKNENPMVATTFKMSSTLKATERNNAARAVVDDMLKWAPDEIKVKSPIYINGKEVMERPARNMDHIVFFEDGKKKFAEVDKYIADIFNNPDSRNMMQSVTGVFRKYNHVFKPMVTSLNVGWAFYNNPSRDARRSMRNLFTLLYSTEGVSKRAAFGVVPKFIAGYSKQLWYKNSEAKNYVRNNLDPAIREMINNGAITRGFFGSYDPYISSQMEPIFKEKGFIGKEKTFKDKMVEKTWATRQAAKLVDKMLFASSVIEAAPKIVGYNILKDAMKNETTAAYYTRNFVGTPFYYEKGKFTHITNELLPFSNVILQGMAADLKLATSPKTRYAYHLYQGISTSSFALMGAAAGAGLFGDDIKRWYGKVDDYIKSNYFVIPITTTEKGKPVFITLPMDEFGRLNYSITHSLATTAFKASKGELKNFEAYWNQFKQVKSIGSGMVPSFSPLATIINGLGSYMADQNIRDSFTGRDVIPPKAFGAKKIDSAPYVAKWAVEKSGGRWMVKLATMNKGKETGWEYVFKNFPVLNRAIRIGGTGQYQAYKEAAMPAGQDRNVELIKMDRVVNDIVQDANLNQKTKFDGLDYQQQMIDEYFGEGGYDATNKDHVRDLKGMLSKYKLRMSRGFDTPADQLISGLIDFGQSKDQQIAILIKGSEMFTPEEYDEMLMDLVIGKLISQEVYKEVLLTTNPEKGEMFQIMDELFD